MPAYHCDRLIVSHAVDCDVSTSPKPAIQLYSVRDIRDRLPDIISQAGEAGFEGIEFANRFREADPEAMADALDESGVTPVAVHANLSDIVAAIEGENDLLTRCRTVGCDRIVVKYISPRHFLSRRTVQSLVQQLTDIAAHLRTHNIEFGYHTARIDCYPFVPMAGEALFDSELIPNGAVYHARRAYAHLPRGDGAALPSDTGLWNLFARTRPDDLFFELESAEITAAGLDPAAVLSLFEGRVPLLHLRDVAPTGRFGVYENVTAGEGVVDFESLVETAATAGVEWLVYEDETDHLSGDEKITRGAAFLEQLLGAESRSGTATAIKSD